MQWRRGQARGVRQSAAKAAWNSRQSPLPPAKFTPAPEILTLRATCRRPASRPEGLSGGGGAGRGGERPAHRRVGLDADVGLARERKLGEMARKRLGRLQAQLADAFHLPDEIAFAAGELAIGVVIAGLRRFQA